jgi:DNA-binding transcriptional ArsR family regulator
MQTTSAATYRAAIPIFAALGDEHRLALVRRLSAHGPTSLSHLCDGAGMTRQGVSKHLHVLASAGLVRRTQRGRQSIWTLAPARMAAAQRALETISVEWDASLARLRAYVEHD